MKKTILIVSLIILIVSSFGFNAKTAKALVMPSVHVVDLTINQTNFQPRQTISGSFAALNSESRAVNDLTYKYLLFIKDETGVPKVYVDEKISQENFNISAGEKRTFSYSYVLPENISSGSYTFRIAVVLSGIPLGWDQKDITITEGKPSLLIDRPFIIKNNVQEAASAGINFEKGEQPRMKFRASNSTGASLSAVPKITIYERSTDQTKIETQTKTQITVGAQQSLDITYELPLYDKAESYLAELQLFDEQNVSLSNKLFFRWVVIGTGGEIIEVTTDKDSYQKGETALVTTFVTGPADVVTPPGEGELTVTLFSSDNTQVGTVKKTIDLSQGYQSVLVPIDEDVSQPIVKVELKKDNVVLADYTVKTGSGKPEEKPLFSNTYYFYLGAAIILGILFYYFIRRRGMKKTAFLLILIGGALFTATSQSVKAAVVEEFLQATGYDYIGNVWNRPLENEAFVSGDYITFQGSFFVPVCLDALLQDTITFYITDYQNQPLDYYGAPLPTSESEARKNEILNTGNSVELGSVYYEGYAEVGLLVEYNQTFMIPDNVPKGDVYARVWFEGAHWNAVEREYNLIVSENIKIDVALVVNKSGSGSGSIISEDTKINCDESCSSQTATYSAGESAVLSASPGSDSTFSGWSGDCSGTGSCTLDMSQDRNVIATFDAILNHQPSASDLSVSQPNYCLITWPAGIFSWQFSDPDADSQSAYQVQVDNNSSFSSPEVDTGKIISSSYSYATLPNALSYNTTYYWRVKVWDGGDLASAWASGSAFSTPQHGYPTIDFSWTPQTPSANEKVNFSDESTVYGGAGKSSWLWTFTDGNPSSSTEQNPTVKFLSAANKTVTLQVEDSDGFSCEGQKTINLQLLPPEWKEIPPF